MKSCLRVLTVFLVIGLLVLPTSLLSQTEQRSLPLEKSIPANVVRTFTFGGHTLTFITAGSGVNIRLTLVESGLGGAPGTVELSFRRDPASGGETPSHLQIYWDTGGEDIYNQTPPAGWIDGVLTEGGWTEK